MGLNHPPCVGAIPLYPARPDLTRGTGPIYFAILRSRSPATLNVHPRTPRAAGSLGPRLARNLAQYLAILARRRTSGYYLNGYLSHGHGFPPSTPPAPRRAPPGAHPRAHPRLRAPGVLRQGLCRRARGWHRAARARQQADALPLLREQGESLPRDPHPQGPRAVGVGRDGPG